MSIFGKVEREMNQAEGLGGPLGDEYMALMTNIAHAALERMQTYRTNGYEDDLRKQFVKPTPLTLEEFRKTGRNVVFKDCFELAGCDITSFSGRVYSHNCYIELCDDGDWYLNICNADYKNGDLRMLEQRLYTDWYMHEAGQ